MSINEQLDALVNTSRFERFKVLNDMALSEYVNIRINASTPEHFDMLLDYDQYQAKFTQVLKRELPAQVLKKELYELQYKFEKEHKIFEEKQKQRISNTHMTSGHLSSSDVQKS